MTRRAARLAVAAAATVLTTAPMMAVTATSASAGQPDGYGPSDPFDDALMGDSGPVEPMKNQAKIVRTDYGFRLIAGQQNSHLTITAVGTVLRFHDAGTRAWKSLPRQCEPRRVAHGVAAVCRAPRATSPSNPTLLEVHPRLGNDYVDGRSLPAVYEMAVLADRGRDTVFGGHGNDFVNGAHDVDHIYAGAGKDWVRGGRAGDRITGGDGGDYLVGQQGADAISGGAGRNRIYQ